MKEQELIAPPDNAAPPGHPSSNARPRTELDLFAVAMLLRRKCFRILVFAAAGFAIMLIEALVMKPTYSATAVLIVPKANPSASSLALQVATGGLDLLGGGYEIYTDILKSHTVADHLIAKYNLKQVYGTKDTASAEKILAAKTSMISEKEGLIRVTVEDTDPRRAADLANSYLAELDQLNQSLAITSAGQQRLFYERQMVKEKDALADAEVELQRVQEQTGVLVPESQAQAHLSAVELTRAQIRLRQVELDGLLQAATNENPDVIRLQSEIGELESQLQKMQKGGGNDTVGMPTSKVPEAALDYLRKAREVKFHEALFEMLAKEYESAKQNEAKTVSMIEVLDRATPPEHKSWPPRALFCLLGLLGGACFGVIYTLCELFVFVVMANPDNRRKYREILGTAPSSPGRGASS